MYTYAVVVHVRRTTALTTNYGAVLPRSAPCVVAVHVPRREANKKAAPCTAGTDGKKYSRKDNGTIQQY